MSDSEPFYSFSEHDRGTQTGYPQEPKLATHNRCSHSLPSHLMCRLAPWPHAARGGAILERLRPRGFQRGEGVREVPGTTEPRCPAPAPHTTPATSTTSSKLSHRLPRPLAGLALALFGACAQPESAEHPQTQQELKRSGTRGKRC